MNIVESGPDTKRDNDILMGIKERLEKTKNTKVAERANVYLKKFETMPEHAEIDLMEMENDFLDLIGGMADESLAGRYPGWTKEDFEEIYRILYGKEAE
jgi:hypothetical protein